MVAGGVTNTGWRLPLGARHSLDNNSAIPNADGFQHASVVGPSWRYDDHDR
jgi:hypothetical protein